MPSARYVLAILAVAATGAALVACGDDENSPQRPTTGDTLETPTSGSPGSTTADGESPPTQGTTP